MTYMNHQATHRIHRISCGSAATLFSCLVFFNKLKLDIFDVSLYDNALGSLCEALVVNPCLCWCGYTLLQRYLLKAHVIPHCSTFLKQHWPIGGMEDFRLLKDFHFSIIIPLPPFYSHENCDHTMERLLLKRMARLIVGWQK